MARLVYDFENPDRFVAGTIGEPGSRAFFLQVRDGNRIVSVLIEKVQVELLGWSVDRKLFGAGSVCGECSRGAVRCRHRRSRPG